MDGRDQGGHLSGLGQVGAEAGCLDAFSGELLYERVQTVLAARDQRDSEAPAGETTSHGRAETGTGSEDGDHFGHGELLTG